MLQFDINKILIRPSSSEGIKSFLRSNIKFDDNSQFDAALSVACLGDGRITQTMCEAVSRAMHFRASELAASVTAAAAIAAGLGLH